MAAAAAILAMAAAENCAPKFVGKNMEAAGHDLEQISTVTTGAACAAACCARPACGGALFESSSAVSYHNCTKGRACCFLKTSVAAPQSMPNPPPGGSELYEIPNRSQDDETLSFVANVLGSHMVLQRAPHQAVVWGFSTPGATVTTTMQSSRDSQKTQATLSSFTTVVGPDGGWRQRLPPTPASDTAYTLTFASSGPKAEHAKIVDVLFGDVYMCGG